MCGSSPGNGGDRRPGTRPGPIPGVHGPPAITPHRGRVPGGELRLPVQVRAAGSPGVGVDRARVEGATDFLVLPATHTFIMNRQDVADEVVHFLREGEFRYEDP